MPVWRDPLDELIAALERVTPVRTEQVFEEMPPMEDFCVLGQAILSRDPAERARLAVDPCRQASRGVPPSDGARGSRQAPSSRRFSGRCKRRCRVGSGRSIRARNIQRPAAAALASGIHLTAA
jgi:hypothetical protein